MNILVKKLLSFIIFLLFFISSIWSQGLPTSKPERVGLSSDRLSRIDEVMHDYIKSKQIAGVVTLIARHGKVAYQKSFGMMDIEANKPMQLDTIVRLYSMTKPVTSVAVMILYEEGHFLLDDPISNFIPGFKDVKVFKNATESGIELAELEHQITIRDLLIHTSGIGYGFFGNSPVEVMYRKAKVFRSDRTLEQNVHNLLKIPLFDQPGSKYRYGASFDVLGYLVEVISGTPFPEFLKQRIFNPLGMNDTGFYVPEDKIEIFAAMYGVTKEGSLQAVDVPEESPYLKASICPSGGGGLFETDPEYHAIQTPTSYGASGGLVSTAGDYMRFAQMLLNKGELNGTRLLSRKTVELMTMNHLTPEILPSFGSNGSGCGFGLEVTMDVAQSEILGSKGMFWAGGAAGTMFWVDPKEELIGIIMPQFQPFNLHIMRQFQVLAYQAIID